MPARLTTRMQGIDDREAMQHPGSSMLVEDWKPLSLQTSLFLSCVLLQLGIEGVHQPAQDRDDDLFRIAPKRAKLSLCTEKDMHIASLDLFAQPRTLEAMLAVVSQAMQVDLPRIRVVLA